MRISFDSNVWERIFDPFDNQFDILRQELIAGNLLGFICEAAFRIEAIVKRNRAEYFNQPHSDFRYEGICEKNEQKSVLFSFGPDDKRHPGIPEIQAIKLQRAMDAGVRLMRGNNWIGLPSPREILRAELFVEENSDERSKRELEQMNVFTRISSRGVGMAKFNKAGGWEALSSSKRQQGSFSKSCAEWADGELVAAHIAYRNDLLCTYDRSVSAVESIFDSSNRHWLAEEYNLVIVTPEDLIKMDYLDRLK